MTTRDALLDGYRKAKKARTDSDRKPSRNICQITSAPTSLHASKFRAAFMRGILESNLMADQGADANFISSAFLQKLMKNSDSVMSNELRQRQTYRNVAGGLCLTCRQ